MTCSTLPPSLKASAGLPGLKASAGLPGLEASAGFPGLKALAGLPASPPPRVSVSLIVRRSLITDYCSPCPRVTLSPCPPFFFRTQGFSRLDSPGFEALAGDQLRYQ